MAEAEARINSIARETLLTYEIGLLKRRMASVGSRRVLFLLAGSATTLGYWWLELRLLCSESITTIAGLNGIGLVVAFSANMIAGVNLWRFASFFSEIHAGTAEIRRDLPENSE
jgi:hypothetical protein